MRDGPSRRGSPRHIGKVHPSRTRKEYEESPYVLSLQPGNEGPYCRNGACITYQVPGATVATAISGSARFGAFSMADLAVPAPESIRASYYALAADVGHASLVLEVFDDA